MHESGRKRREWIHSQSTYYCCRIDHILGCFIIIHCNAAGSSALAHHLLGDRFWCYPQVLQIEYPRNKCGPSRWDYWWTVSLRRGVHHTWYPVFAADRRASNFHSFLVGVSINLCCWWYLRCITVHTCEANLCRRGRPPIPFRSCRR